MQSWSRPLQTKIPLVSVSIPRMIYKDDNIYKNNVWYIGLNLVSNSFIFEFYILLSILQSFFTFFTNIKYSMMLSRIKHDTNTCTKNLKRVWQSHGVKRAKQSEAERRLSLIVLKALKFDVVYPLLCASQSLFLDKSKVHRYCISTNSFHPWIVSAEQMSYGGVFSANIWICYNLQIQKKVSVETICGNTVCIIHSSLIFFWDWT